jgi:hypothetical protein
MTSDQIITMIVTAIITGGFSTVTTVTALKVHINYLRESIARHEQAITRAHNRIDHIDKSVFKGEPKLIQ